MIRLPWRIAILISGLILFTVEGYTQKRSVVSKADLGAVNSNSFPDICKTPVPGGPVPIPYPNKTISTKDQKAILSLFKGLDQKKYSVKFKNASTKKNITSGRYRYSNETLRKAGWSPSDVSTKDNLFVLVVYDRSWESFLGRDRARILNKILSKYR